MFYTSTYRCNSSLDDPGPVQRFYLDRKTGPALKPFRAQSLGISVIFHLSQYFSVCLDHCCPHYNIGLVRFVYIRGVFALYVGEFGSAEDVLKVTLDL